MKAALLVASMLMATTPSLGQDAPPAEVISDGVKSYLSIYRLTAYAEICGLPEKLAVNSLLDAVHDELELDLKDTLPRQGAEYREAERIVERSGFDHYCGEFKHFYNNTLLPNADEIIKRHKEKKTQQ